MQGPEPHVPHASCMLYVEQPVSVVNLVLAGIRTAVLASLCRIGVWSFAVFFDVFFPLEKNPVSHVAFTLSPLYLFISACECRPKVTVTSSSTTPFVSPRGIFKTNRFS